MIGIKYLSVTPSYDEYINKFRLWIERNIRQRRYSVIYHNGAIDPQTERFVNWLLNSNNLIKLCNASDNELKNYIAYITTNFNNLRQQNQHSQIYKDLYSLFVKHGYIDGFHLEREFYQLNKVELYEATGVEVCPYCNRTYIRKQVIQSRQKIVKGELDHFYSKELYPYLAIAKYNLVPCCSFCNGRAGKYTEDAYTKKMLNPFSIKDNNTNLMFRLSILNNKVVNMDTASKGLGINIIPTNQSMGENIEIFNLSELYKHHTDHAAELLLKSKIYGANPYREFIKKLFRRKNIQLEDHEIDRIIIGNYPSPSDFGKRPLAKLYHDIALELGLITE